MCGTYSHAKLGISTTVAFTNRISKFSQFQVQCGDARVFNRKKKSSVVSKLAPLSVSYRRYRKYQQYLTILDGMSCIEYLKI